MGGILSNSSNNNNLSRKKNHSLPPLDTSQFLKNYEGLEGIRSEVIVLLFSQLPKMMKNIQNAIQGENSKDLTITAHSLRGTVSNFFAEPSKDIAWNLEQLGQKFYKKKKDPNLGTIKGFIAEPFLSNLQGPEQGQPNIFSHFFQTKTVRPSQALHRAYNCRGPFSILPLTTDDHSA
jgi:hypothetical protein